MSIKSQSNPVIASPVRKIKKAANGSIVRVLNAMSWGGFRIKHRHSSIDSLPSGLPRPALQEIYHNITS